MFKTTLLVRHWELCGKTDELSYTHAFQEKALTRRGVLSTVMSVFDPLGLLSPFILVGKRILQSLCKAGYSWDEPIPGELIDQWIEWRSQLEQVHTFSVPRCVSSSDLPSKAVELHLFSDASSVGYGCCCYVKVIDANDKVQVSLLTAKSRVVPKFAVSIPRLELTAAVVAVQMSQMILRECTLAFDRTVFWTDSKVVLAYIRNETKRFHVFVANRIGYIQLHTVPEQWRFVPGKENPADIASRGVPVTTLKSGMWASGPNFLNSPVDFCFPMTVAPVCNEDVEVKGTCLHTVSRKHFHTKVFAGFSRWSRLKRAVSAVLIWMERLKSKSLGKGMHIDDVIHSHTSSTMYQAELVILKLVQRDHFAAEVQNVEDGRPVAGRSKLSGLNCLLQEGLLKVGGRLKHSTLSLVEKYPVILPQSDHVSKLIATHCHECVAHQGRTTSIGCIRSQSYWIVGVRALVSSLIHHCVLCRRMRAVVSPQQMSDLPADRTEQAPPFTFCGVDLFGPILGRERRSELKRWGCLFTRLASRAVHIETVNSLSTSSFINALRRFTSIRGPITLLRCDNATNFTGAHNDLARELTAMNDECIKGYLLRNGGTFEFKFNNPHASHTGGVWEKLIRTVRSILADLLRNHSGMLCDESLRTLLCECAAIMDARPLAVQTLADPEVLTPLSPAQLLTMKSNVMLTPPGEFESDSLYAAKHWKRVQYLINEFWRKFRVQYLHLLQTRQKWTAPRRNFCCGDLVLIKDDLLPRNLWRLGKIVEVTPSPDDLVRSVKVQVNACKEGKKPSVSTLSRSVHQLILVLEV